MSEDIYSRRVEFLEEFKDVFVRTGWNFFECRGEYPYVGEDPYEVAIFQIEPKRLSFVYRIDMVRVDPMNRMLKFHFGVGLGLPEFTDIESRVFSNEKCSETDNTGLAGIVVSDVLPASKSEYRDFITNLSQRFIDWGALQDVKPRIIEYAEPWRTEWQLPHLAALAYTGDFVTLIEYQELFKRGKRANFYPMIKAEMIDRALDIALERG